MTATLLTLTYPDIRNGKVRLLAVTSDRRALLTFKNAVLEEIRLRLLDCEDPVLKIEFQGELTKMEKLFALLIPEIEAPHG